MKSKEEIYVISLIFFACGIEIKEIDNPIEYLNANYKNMLREDVINYIYENIKNIQPPNKLKSSEVIALLIRKFIMFNYDENNFLIKYLSMNNCTDVYQFFCENYYFAKELITSYYGNLKKISEEKMTPAVGLMAKFDSNFEINVISQMLRDAFHRMYSSLESLAKTMGQTPGNLFLLVLSGYAIIGGNSQMEEDLNLLRAYKPYLFRLIYADVYEDLIATGVFANSDRKISIVVKNAVEKNSYELDLDAEKLDILLGYFNYLAGNQEKRNANRKVVKNKDLDNLKKINPLWILDESDIIKKR